MAAVSNDDELWAVRRRMVEDLRIELRERALVAGDTRDVELVETHISWVLIGTDVYKIKKPIQLPFLDFSTSKRGKRLVGPRFGSTVVSRRGPITASFRFESAAMVASASAPEDPSSTGRYE